MRELTETTRGALFTHTQNGDLRFDDVTNAPAADPNRRLLDIARFMEEQIDPPELRALLDPNDPDYARLVRDPFATVPIATHQQRHGASVFRTYCMDCHNMPNVFSNRDHVNNPPTASPPPYAHTFDIGVAQRNALNLEFRFFDAATGQRVPLVLPLVRADGQMIDVTVVDDVGLAGSTGRYEDLHKFKVPQLRRISQLGPYFHDNSVPTLEGVVDYFNGADYNSSPDGRSHPIHLSAEERFALLAFLRIL
jgi:cytochrome c peroxidase